MTSLWGFSLNYEYGVCLYDIDKFKGTLISSSDLLLCSKYMFISYTCTFELIFTKICTLRITDKVVVVFLCFYL